MDISRRQFIFVTAACGCAIATGCVANPAPILDAGVDHSLPLPDAPPEPVGTSRRTAWSAFSTSLSTGSR